MRTNKIRILPLFLLILLFFTSCDKKNLFEETQALVSGNTKTLINPVETVESVQFGDRLCDHLGFPDQSQPPVFNGAFFPGVSEIETDYSGIQVSLDSSSFKKNCLIRIHIENKYGKPYLLYPIPYVELFNEDNSSWDRLTYAPDELYYATDIWNTCVDKSDLCFNPNYLSTRIIEGKYRFIIFAGDKTIYSSDFYIVTEE